MEEKKNKNIKIIIIVGIVIITLIGISYAWLHVTLRGEKEVSIIGDKLELILDETNEGIQIGKTLPVKDEEGRQVEAYTFTLENKGNQKIDYSIYLDTDSEAMKECVDCQELSEKDIRYELKINNIYSIETLDSSRLLDKGTIGTEKINYELKIWLNYDADNDAQGKVFYGKIRVEGSQIINNYENGTPNPPVLADNMIPVVYNGYNWVKADISSRWYDYERQNWANAVTVTNETREAYQKAEAGAKVNMNDILQMYVWIPRYSYTIKSEDGKNYYGKQETGRETIPTKALPGEIDVKFISTSTTDEGSAQYTGSKAEGWYTPPGFTFGEKNLSGIWIGKFETGTITEKHLGDVEIDNSVVIKPNIISWRDIRVSTLELVSMGITKSGNIYGFDQSTYDSHASKNTEWALMAYFTQSKYGKYGNPLYTGENKEVYMNNHSSPIAGCSSGKGSSPVRTNICAFQYNDLTNQGEGQGYGGAGASTTGNITGIYDTNGGAWEYVMGVFNKISGNTASANSGYTGQLTDGSSFQSDREWPDEKYYDLYTTTNTNTACNGTPCKGHALGEVAGWYDDLNSMISSSNPWSTRSGCSSHSSGAGIFRNNHDYGNANGNASFRIVLTPNN